MAPSVFQRKQRTTHESFSPSKSSSSSTPSPPSLSAPPVDRFARYTQLSRDADPGRGHYFLSGPEDNDERHLPAGIDDDLMPPELTHVDVLPRAYAMEQRTTVNLKDMRICEVVNGGMGRIQHLQFKCAEDPSCLKCVPQPLLEVSNILLEVHQDPSLFTARRDTLLRLFPRPPAPGQGHPIIVMATDTKYMDYVLNWLCVAEERMHKDIHSYVLIVALDQQTVDICVRRQLKYITYFSDTLSKIEKVVMAVNELIHLNHSAIMQDTDLAWVKDPVPFLRRSKFAFNMDILGQVAPRWDAQGQVNTGFVFIRSNKKTKLFMDSLVSAIPLMLWKGDDQIVWNHLLRLWVFRQLHWQLIPHTIVRGVVGGKEVDHRRQITNRTLVAHVLSGTGQEKRDRLATLGLWMYNTPQCPAM
eukprot:CAMPEP_0118956876 /NCGR_PEP_ID=MMETSP1169-20130426/61807_1 /TAXON_ID=36882 /ORGANISM="Pyramimonas obovata, Strain CCMP722" /LENGTH=414 /DNA_ID=CAMNT_0006904925 /DNA_START=667 /DNA_END=1912 /DNA_ORIENTATION=-